MSLGASLSGVSRFCHVGELWDREALQRLIGPAGGMASCLLGDLAHLAQSHLLSEWSPRLPIRWKESEAKLPHEAN